MDGNSAGGPGAGAGAGAGASPTEPGSSPGTSSGTAPGSGSAAGPRTGMQPNAAKASTASTASTASASHPGCGCLSHPAINPITVTVSMTTGGQFTLQVDQLESVETLKKMASKKLRVPKERICLLYRDRQLSGGTLIDHLIVNGSRITLLPNVETGLLAQRPEQSVMQALESLNDGQVNDFLSGKAPLNLTMRFGDHMMLIQLQLSTVSPQVSRTRASAGSSSTSSASSRVVPGSSTSSSTSSGSASSASRPMRSAGTRRSAVPAGLVPKTAASSSASSSASPVASATRSMPGDALSSPSVGQPMGPPANPPPSSSSPARSAGGSPTASTSSSSSPPASPTAAAAATASGPSSPSPLPDPLASLPSPHACEALFSQLVDSATQAMNRGERQASAAASACNVTENGRRPLFRASDTNCRTSDESKSEKVCPSASTPSPSAPASPKQGASAPVARKVVIRPATFLASESASASSSTSTCTTCTSTCMPICSTQVHPTRSTSPMPSTSPSTTSTPVAKGAVPCPEDSTSATCTCEASLASRCPMAYRQETRVHTRALAEASRNLMQTLKQLSSEVMTNREEEDTAAARRRQGAIIESMHSHGKGVYSGTFSGTLNPALQDRFGRPKRDISTVIHILNDLLCATPQYRRSYPGLPQSNFVLESSTSITTTTSPGETIDAQSAPSPTSDDAENQATRGKVERLRLVMEERRERRRARREARHSPYGPSQPQHWTAKSETQPAGKGEAMDTDQPLCDISPPEPVVA